MVRNAPLVIVIFSPRFVIARVDSTLSSIFSGSLQRIPPAHTHILLTRPTPFDVVTHIKHIHILRMETLNITLIGAQGVGKSSFIQRVLGLSKLPSGNTTSTRLVVDKVQYIVTLIELDLESFDIDPNREIQWPKQIAGQIIPHIDGALILYDVMNRESIVELPQTMCKSKIPLLGSVQLFLISPLYFYLFFFVCDQANYVLSSVCSL